MLDKPTTATEMVVRAAECREAARRHEDRGESGLAIACYLEADRWLWRADHPRGVRDARPRLDAKVELLRRRGEV